MHIFLSLPYETSIQNVFNQVDDFLNVPKKKK